ncbi:MAG: CvpA family protein [Elusimicrobiota bacterium]
MFNIFDVIILIIAILCAYFGFSTGVIASMFYVCSGFAGMWAAHKFSVQLGMNFYLVFAMASIAVVIIGFVLGKILKGLLLGGIDKAGGLVFGVTLGLAVFAVLLFPLSKKLPEKLQNIASTSFSSNKIMPVMKKLLPAISEFDLETVKESMPDIKLPEKINLEIDVPKNLKKEAAEAKEKLKSAVKKPAEKK